MPLLDIKLLEENAKFWEGRYRNNSIEWHINDVNPMLFKHLKTLLPSRAGEDSKTDSNSKKIFIPLCGKTKDIPFLLSLGHEVFGVESFSAAIEELNDEHNLQLKYDQQSFLYESEDGKVKIYCGDYFNCPIETWGPFDAVWDRGSFIAIDYPLREAYIELMKRAVGFGTGHKFRYLLQAVRYNKSMYPGPPRCVDIKDMALFLESWASVETLEMYPVGIENEMDRPRFMDNVFHWLEEIYNQFKPLTPVFDATSNGPRFAYSPQCNKKVGTGFYCSRVACQFSLAINYLDCPYSYRCCPYNHP